MKSGLEAYPIVSAIDWVNNNPTTINNPLEKAIDVSAVLYTRVLFSSDFEKRKKAVSIPKPNKTIKKATLAYNSDTSPYSATLNLVT